MEEFKVITGFETYEVSNLGNVRNIITGRLLKLCLSTAGYHRVCLNKKCHNVHRFVALAFIENPENKEFVDHIDKNRTNNNVNNLRWATRTENNINKTLRKDCITGIAGVSFYKRLNKWCVRIHINGIKKHIGYYIDFNEAVKIRKEQEDIHYKNFKPTHI